MDSEQEIARTEIKLPSPEYLEKMQEHYKDYGSPAFWARDLQMHLEKVRNYLSDCGKILNREQISSALVWADSYSRFDAFLEIVPRLRGADYWYALGYAYGMCDNLYAHKEQVKKAFKRRLRGREALMNKREIKYLNALPKTVTIYRGMTREEAESMVFGISWTLKKRIAEFFAYEYDRNQATAHMNKVVAKLKIKKSDIIAVFLDRKEFEVIYVNKRLLRRV